MDVIFLCSFDAKINLFSSREREKKRSFETESFDDENDSGKLFIDDGMKNL